MIEYTLIIACISLVIAVAGPPVAEAVQGQFNKVAEVISNGSTGGTGGGSDFPGGGSGNEQGGGGDHGGGGTGGGNGGDHGGSGGGSGNTESDKDKDGIPDNEDAYPDDPLNGTGDKDGDGIADKDDQYPDDPLNGKPAEKKMAGTITMSDCTVGLTSTVVATGTPTDAQVVYQWYVDGKADTTGASRAFTAADANKSVYVAASDATGEYKGQIATAIQRVQTREMKGQVSFGDLVVGKTASANVSGAPSGAQIAYKWYADGVIVSSEQTFTPAAEHVGKSVYVEVTDKGGVFTESVASATKTVVADGASKPAENILTGSLSIGDCVVGLTTNAFAADVPADATLSYTWQIGTTSVGGASHAFTQDEADAEVRVTAVDGSGKYKGTLYSNVVRVKMRSITGSVAFSEAVVGRDLSAIVSGVPSDIRAQLEYKWTVDGTEVSREAAYTPKTDDIGKVLILEVTDGSGKYAGSLVSNAQIVRAKSADAGEGGTGGGGQQGAPLTGRVIINNAKVGLAASVTIEGAPRDAVLKVEWTLDWQSVGSELTYQVPLKTRGKHLAAIVSDTSGKYSSTIYDDEVIGSAPLVGKISINDTTPITGQTVTASVSGTQSDAVLSYQWKADGVAIQGATKASYTLTDNEVGKILTFEAVDTGGNYDNAITGTAHPYASWVKSPDSKVAETVAAADAGTIKLTDYWKSGDKRTVKLSSMGSSSISGIDETHAAQSVEYVLSDPGHFTLANGKKCNFTVIQKDCLKESGAMNPLGTSSGGWEEAPRRTWCNTTYRNALPAALKPIFKQFKVTTANGTGSGTTVSTDYFSLFSEKEVFGTTYFANSTVESANTQLDYFKASGNRVKKANGSASYWWERSPYSGSPNRFCYVSSDGSANAYYAYGTYGLAPFGCI